MPDSNLAGFSSRGPFRGWSATLGLQNTKPPPESRRWSAVPSAPALSGIIGTPAPWWHPGINFPADSTLPPTGASAITNCAGYVRRWGRNWNACEDYGGNIKARPFHM